MYYLLSDNIILDENRFKKVGYSIRTQEKGLSKYLYLTSWSGEKFLGTIKNQSENVYDLIEKGDLVKTFGIFRVDEINTPLNQIYTCLDRKSMMVINTLGVKAIYKLDEEGNYIKAWEEKEYD